MASVWCCWSLMRSSRTKRPPKTIGIACVVRAASSEERVGSGGRGFRRVRGLKRRPGYRRRDGGPLQRSGEADPTACAHTGGRDDDHDYDESGGENHEHVQEDAETIGLRVYVKGGGCHGRGTRCGESHHGFTERPVVGRYRSGLCGWYTGGRFCEEESAREDHVWKRQFVQRLTPSGSAGGDHDAYLARCLA